MNDSVTVIVPTIGRPSLRATLESIVSQRQPQDETIVVGNCRHIQQTAAAFGCRYIPCQPGRDWGHTERNVVSPQAKGAYVAHIDDDDVYAPGARAAMADAIRTTPNRPVMFKMSFPNLGGLTIWSAPVMNFGNVGTPMFLIPNVPEKFGTWGHYNGGDFGFLQTMKWAPSEIVWRPEVIALIRP